MNSLQPMVKVMVFYDSCQDMSLGGGIYHAAEIVGKYLMSKFVFLIFPVLE